MKQIWHRATSALGLIVVAVTTGEYAQAQTPGGGAATSVQAAPTGGVAPTSETLAAAASSAGVTATPETPVAAAATGSVTVTPETPAAAPSAGVAPAPAAPALPAPASSAAPPAPAPASTGGLAQAPDWQARALEPKAERVGEIFQGVAAKSDGRSDWNIPLVQGRCYLFSGVGDATVEKLFFFLWDPKDTRVDTVKPYGALVVSRYCAPVSGSYHVQLKVADGKGAYALGTYVVPGPSATAPANLDELGRARAAATGANAVPYGNPLVGPGPGVGRGSWSLNLAPGACYWFVGAGDARVKSSKLQLFGPNNKLATETANDSPTPALTYCTPTAATVNLQARVGGDGIYQVVVYSRPMPAAAAPQAVAAAAAVAPSSAAPPAPKPAGPSGFAKAMNIFGKVGSVLDQASNVQVTSSTSRTECVNGRCSGEVRTSTIGGPSAAAPRVSAGSSGPGFSAGFNAAPAPQVGSPSASSAARNDLGRSCSAGSECSGGICANGSCSQTCSGAGDCPSGWVCDTLAGVMEKANGGRLGSGQDSSMMRAASSAMGKVCFRGR